MMDNARGWILSIESLRISYVERYLFTSLEFTILTFGKRWIWRDSITTYIQLSANDSCMSRHQNAFIKRLSNFGLQQLGIHSYNTRDDLNIFKFKIHILLYMHIYILVSNIHANSPNMTYNFSTSNCTKYTHMPISVFPFRLHSTKCMIVKTLFQQQRQISLILCEDWSQGQLAEI